METWWPVDQTGLWFGLIGGGVGCVLGVGVPVVCIFLLPRASGRRCVVTGMAAISAIGITSIVAGGLAIADDQPYEVYYPLLLLGGVLYWTTACAVLPVDAMYRVAGAMRKAGVEPGMAAWGWDTWGWGLGGGIGVAALDSAWRGQGRGRRWTLRLMWGHLGIGTSGLVWGIAHYLAGGQFQGWFPAVLLGSMFVVSAGELWLTNYVMALTLRNAEQQRLAAEEFRRSGAGPNQGEFR